MKKRIFLVIGLFAIGISWVGYRLLANDKKIIEEEKEVTSNVVIKQKELYVSLVPIVNQEYTIISKKESEESNNNIEEVLLVFKEENLITEDIALREKYVDEVIDDEEKANITDEEDNELLNENKLENNTEKKEIVDEQEDLKNGFYDEDGITYYYEENVKVTGLKNINGVNSYFSPSGKYLGNNNIKIVDVSYYQGDINWDLFKEESDCYGVILRLGYYDTLDKKFERNILELKRLNIPYGIYFFSYSTSLNGAKKEAEFTNNMIDKYDISPTLGIYYDIESWSTKTSSSNNITKGDYDKIIQYYINSVSNHANYKYKVKVYSGRWYAMNRLGDISKKYVDWVAEYNSSCKYDDAYSMWQYTSKGSVPGINGNVDISYLY